MVRYLSRISGICPYDSLLLKMMQMKKFMKWIVVLVVTVSVGFLTGCDDDENGPDAPKAQLITDAELRV